MPHHDVAMETGVYVPPRQQRDRGPTDMDFVVEQRGDSNGACSLGDLAFEGERVPDAGRDLVLVQQDNVIDQFLAHSKSVLIGKSNAAAERIRQRFDLGHTDSPASGETCVHRCTARHRDADHPRFRLHRLHRGGDASRQTSARERNKHGFDLGKGLHNLEADRTLAGNDFRVIEGRDLREALLAREALDLDLGLILRGADDASFRAERSDSLDLVRWDERGHADYRPHADFSRCIGNGSAVVAGRGCNEAFGSVMLA